MMRDSSIPILSAGESFRGVLAEEGIPVTFAGGSLDGADRFTVGTISPVPTLLVGNQAYLVSGDYTRGRLVYRLATMRTYVAAGDC